MNYKVFISYSHAADNQLAPTLQSALQKFARPFYKLRSLNVFRDKTSLRLTPELWPLIQVAIKDSEFFLLLASPDAAASVWVQKEVEEWYSINHGSLEHFLIVMTDGHIEWDNTVNDFNWSVTTALPANLKGRFTQEPFYADMKWAKKEAAISLRNPQFLDDIATLAATLHNKPKDTMVGEDVRQHKVFKLVTGTAIAVLIVLLGLSIIAGIYANERKKEAIVAAAGEKKAAANERLARQEESRQRQLAEKRRVEAEAQTQIAKEQREEAIRQRETAEENLYNTHIKLASQHYEVGNTEAANALLEKYIPQHNNRDLRGFEWYFLYRALHKEKAVLLHDNPVWCVRFSPAGNLIATLSQEVFSSPVNTLTLWDAQSGKMLYRIKEERQYKAIAIAFSRDGNYLAIEGKPDLPVSAEKNHPGRATIQLWKIAKNGKGIALQKKKQLYMDLRYIRCFEFLPDDKRMAVVEGGERTYNTRLIILDIETNNLLSSRRTGLDEPTAMSVSPDGKWIGVLNATQVNLCEVGKPENKPTVIISNFACSLSIAPDNETVAIGLNNGKIKLYNISSNQEIALLVGHSKAVNTDVPSVNCVGFSPDGTLLVSAGTDRIIKVWNWKKHEELYSLKGHVSGINALSFSPDGTTLATGSVDKTTRLWTLKDETAALPFRLYTDFFSFSPDGKTIAVLMIRGGENGQILQEYIGLIDVATQTIAAEFPFKAYSFFPQNTVVFSPKNSLLAIGNGNGLIDIWEPGSRTKKAVLRGLDFDGSIASDIVQLCFSPDARALSAINTNGDLMIWDLASRKALYKMDGGVTDMQFSPLGNLIAVTRKEGIVEIKEGNSFHTIRSIRENRRFLSHLQFSPDGSLLAYTGVTTFSPLDGPLVAEEERYETRIIDPHTGKLAGKLQGHSLQVGSISFSPDGKTIATGSSDGMVKLWSAKTFEELMTLKGHENKTGIQAHFSPAGNLLATSALYQIKLWPASGKTK